MIKCILYHNNYYHLDYYKRDEMMVEDDVPCIPIELWNWGIANREEPCGVYRRTLLNWPLCLLDTAVVTEKGIKYKDMYYASSNMLKMMYLQMHGQMEGGE